MAEVNRLQELYLRALDMPPEERTAWLVERCGPDQQLLSSVKALLAHEFPEDDPLEMDVQGALGLRLDMSDLGPRSAVSCPNCRNETEIESDGERVTCALCGAHLALVGFEHAPFLRPNRSGSIQQFKLVEEIGAGAFGTVFKAHDTQLDRIVAVKIPHKLQLSATETDQFLREARAAAHLSHPNIVSIHEVGHDQGVTYLVSDYIDGCTLGEFTARIRLSPKRAAELCITLCRALHHAHNQGVVHRDLKPGNIMLDQDEVPYIVDFGLAKRELGDVTMTVDGHVLGTPAYMSPEQAWGKGHQADRRSDIFSMGVILFELLTGERPFRGNLQMVLQQLRTHDAPRLRTLNSTIPRDLETICLKCLSREPNRRYQSARELADDLTRWLANQPIHARHVTRLEKSWLWCRRRPVITALVVGFVAILVGGALFALGREHRLGAEALADRILSAETRDVPQLVRSGRRYHASVAPILRKALASDRAGSDPKHALHAAIALVATEPQVRPFLCDRLLDADADETRVIVQSLTPWSAELSPRLWQAAQVDSARGRLRAASALAAYDADNQLWDELNGEFVRALLQEPVQDAGAWAELLRPAARHLIEPLKERFVDQPGRSDNDRLIAALALADFLSERPDSLIELVLAAESQGEFRPLVSKLRPHTETAARRLRELLRDSLKDRAGERSDQHPQMPWSPVQTLKAINRLWTDTARSEQAAQWRKQANAAICLLALGETDTVWPLFRNSPNPSLRSLLVERIALLGIDPQLLADRLAVEPDAAKRYALVLTLGQYQLRNMSSPQQATILGQLAALVQQDPEPGVHSASRWVLQKWQREDTIRMLELDPASSPNSPKHHWFVNSLGQTFAIIETTAADQKASRFAIATHEVTVEQFQRLLPVRTKEGISPTAACPMNSVSWFQAVAYCNLLSAQEGIPRDQWCYEPNEQGDYAPGMKVPADALERTGYRLPTHQEWVQACRAGTTTYFHFGDPTELLSSYTWWVGNSRFRMWPVGTKLPNGLGLFDMHGNAAEWSHQQFPSGTVASSKATVRVCGWDYDDQPVQMSSFLAGRQSAVMPALSDPIGIRLARTLPVGEVRLQTP